MAWFKCIGLTLVSIIVSYEALAIQESALLLSLPGLTPAQIEAVNGSCLQYQGGPCQTGNFSALDPIGIKFPINNPPRVKISTTSQTGAQFIDQYKGTISFDYTPLGTDQSDWGQPLSNQARIKTLFKLGDTAQQLQIIIYNDGAKSYLAFRHDAINNCSGTGCQRSVSTSRYEPGIVTTWTSGEKHQITVSWNFSNMGTPYMAIYLDGRQAIVEKKSSAINSDGFNPTYMYIGADHTGNNPAQGIIGNLKIYSDEFINKDNPVADFIYWKKDNGVWDPHETISQTSDAPPPFNTGNKPLVFYKTADFLPAFPGQVPLPEELIEKIDILTTKNEFETSFFNVYFGPNAHGIAEITISDLTAINSPNNTTISCSDLMLRTVKYWWQAGSGTSSIDKEAIPAYIPELLLFNEANSTNTLNAADIQPPNDTNPCSATSTSTTYANIEANTSKQFAITLKSNGYHTPSTYRGTISVKLSNGNSTAIPIEISIVDLTLPSLNKYASIYHENLITSSPTQTEAESKAKYIQQLKNIRDHGFNGLIIYGNQEQYLKLAIENGLSSFTPFVSTTDINDKIKWFQENNVQALFMGQDEPHLRSNKVEALNWQVSDANKIHLAGGKVATSINKEYADQLNDSNRFPWNGVAFPLGKLDVPILSAEPPPNDLISNTYFDSLLRGDKSPDRQELIYWQAARENPKVNRYFSGYFTYLSRLAGIAPYVYQKIRGNPFNDFEIRSNGERSLNLVYPSTGGSIDTIQWESMREGLDDHRMLQLFDRFYQILWQKNPTLANSFKSELDAITQKYRSWNNKNNLDTKGFSSDRTTLINLLLRMQSHIITSTVELSISANEDDGWEFEDSGQIYRPNGYQIWADAGGNYFGTWASYSHYGAALRFHIPLTAKKSSNLYSATLRLLRNNVSATGTPKVAIKAYKNTNCSAFSNTNRPYRNGVEYTTASTLLEFPNPELNAVGSWIDIDITTIMRELMQQATWAGTHSSICLIGINLKTTGSHEFGIRDSAEGAYSSPRLILNYE